MSSGTSSHPHWMWDMGKFKFSLRKARQAQSSAWGRPRVGEMPWDISDVLLVSVCKGAFSGRDRLNGVGPRGWECFYAMDASSLLGWLCWDKEWKVTSSTVMREGSGRSCPNYWWLFSPFSFDAGVRGALRAYLPKKSEGGKNRSNNSIELFAGVV